MLIAVSPYQQRLRTLWCILEPDLLEANDLFRGSLAPAQLYIPTSLTCRDYVFLTRSRSPVGKPQSLWNLVSGTYILLESQAHHCRRLDIFWSPFSYSASKSCRQSPKSMEPTLCWISRPPLPTTMNQLASLQALCLFSCRGLIGLWFRIETSTSKSLMSVMFPTAKVALWKDLCCTFFLNSNEYIKLWSVGMGLWSHGGWTSWCFVFISKNFGQPRSLCIWAGCHEPRIP